MLLDTKFGDVWAPVENCKVHYQDPEGKISTVYTNADGRFVGSDGFVVPQHFHEFIERYPDYIKAYAYKYMHRVKGVRYDPDTFEDVASELSLFLFDLSPGRQAYKDGKRDYVQCFDPVRQYGAKKGQFFNYINLILSNRFSSYVYGELLKDPALNGFHLTWDDGSGSEQDSSQESHLVVQVTQPKVTMEENIISSMQVEAMIQRAVNSVPEADQMVVSSVLRAVVVFDKRSEIADALGMTKEEINKTLKKVKRHLGETSEVFA